MAGELTAEELADLSTRRRQVRERHDLGVAQQDYLKGVAVREHGRGLGDLIDQYRDVREKVPYAFNARGLLNSGLHAAKVAELGKQFGKQSTNLQGRLADTLSGYDLASQQLGAVQHGALGDLNELEAARIASVAASLRQAGF